MRKYIFDKNQKANISKIQTYQKPESIKFQAKDEWKQYRNFYMFFPNQYLFSLSDIQRNHFRFLHTVCKCFIFQAVGHSSRVQTWCIYWSLLWIAMLPLTFNSVLIFFNWFLLSFTFFSAPLPFNPLSMSPRSQFT